MSLYEYNIHSQEMLDHGEVSMSTGAAMAITSIKHTQFMMFLDYETEQSRLAVFDLKSLELQYPWMDVTDPGIYRFDSCLASYADRYLLIVGGGYLKMENFDFGLETSIDILDLDLSDWIEDTQDLSFGRASPGCVVVNDYLYVISGTIKIDALFGDSHKIYTKSVEKLYIGEIENTQCYDWIFVGNITNKVGALPVVIGQFIYVIGIL